MQPRFGLPLFGALWMLSTGGLMMVLDSVL